MVGHLADNDPLFTTTKISAGGLRADTRLPVVFLVVASRLKRWRGSAQENGAGEISHMSTIYDESE